MNTYYQIGVRYIKMDETGKLRKVTENYLLDAINFTEAEASAYKELAEMVSGEFLVSKIAKTDFAEIIPSDGDKYYKGKVAFLVFDENTGKSKRTTVNVLAQANSVDHADQLISDAYAYMTLGAEIVSVSESKILDIFLSNKQ